MHDGMFLQWREPLVRVLQNATVDFAFLWHFDRDLDYLDEVQDKLILHLQPEMQAQLRALRDGQN